MRTFVVEVRLIPRNEAEQAGMSATKLTRGWESVDSAESFPVELDRNDLLFPGGWELRVRRCPHCQAVVYSRRHAHCGVCEEPLPADCRFDTHQARRVETLIRSERERYLEWRRKLSV